jgi:hypothetical protein
VTQPTDRDSMKSGGNLERFILDVIERSALAKRLRGLRADWLGPQFQAIPAAANWTSTATWSSFFGGRLIVLQGDFSKTGGGGTPAPGDVMGTLPAAAAPANQLDIGTVSQNNDAVASLLIQTSGNIVWRTGSTVETDHIYLDGHSFVRPG